MKKNHPHPKPAWIAIIAVILLAAVFFLSRPVQEGQPSNEGQTPATQPQNQEPQGEIAQNDGQNATGPQAANEQNNEQNQGGQTAEEKALDYEKERLNQEEEPVFSGGSGSGAGQQNNPQEPAQEPAANTECIENCIEAGETTQSCEEICGGAA